MKRAVRLMGADFVMQPVKSRGHWRVQMTWPRAHGPTRYFGKFDSEAEAKRWIAEHRWLTKQNLERQPDPPGTTDPTTPNA
jgi:hypothetical protein